MIKKPFILKIFNATNMHRWNDKMNPVELRELDKQAHKMIIAYMLGRFEEKKDKSVDWIKIIEGGIFQFLQRLVITDLKPQLFHKIQADKNKYSQLNKYVCKQLEPIIKPIGTEFYKKFKEYINNTDEDINQKILNAAHFYATKWEFNIIERANPDEYEIPEIKSYLLENQEKYYGLEGMKQLARNSDLRNFIDLCGALRFQVRWSYFNMVPEISVLGHMLIVAILSYLFSLEAKVSTIRGINNYFTGLFHDLPEVLTRDVVNPVKTSISGLDDLIKKYEKEEMEDKVYKIIPADWHSEMKMYTENEFENIKIKGEIIRDGKLVKAVDSLTAFVEVYLTLGNGITNSELSEAKELIRKGNQGKNILGIKFEDIYKDFDKSK